MNLEEIGIDKSEIVERCAAMLCEEIRPSLESDIRKATKERMKEGVNAAVDAETRKVLDGIYQPVDVFGDKKGEPTTIREHMAKRASDWMTEKVDSRGNTATGYGASGTRAQFLANEALREAMDKTLRELMEDCRKKLVAGLKGAVTEALTDRIAKIR